MGIGQLDNEELEMSMIRLPHLAACLFFSLFGSFPLLAGNTIVGTGTPASCTEAALNAAVTNANNTFGIVTFNCGPAPHTIVLTSEKALANGVIVDGGGKITLSGGNVTRIFNIFQGAAVQIANLTLVGGFAPAGGCLLAFSSVEEPVFLTLNGVTFTDCRATNYGGAIAATAAALVISDSRFASNVAELGGGGAISLNGGNLDVARSGFDDNDAVGQGGALQIWFATTNLDDSTFLRNHVDAAEAGVQAGGAVLLRSSIANLRRCRIGLGTSFGSGAGVLAIDGSTLLLEDTWVESNYSNGGFGGGLSVDATSSANLLRSTFLNNRSAVGGGAIYSLGGLTVTNSTITGNLVLLDSPGITLAGNATLNMVSSTLVDNASLLTPENAGQLTWTSGVTVTVHNTLFSIQRVATRACAGASAGAFSFSIWPDTTCGGATTNGNQPNTFVPLATLSKSCGGLASDLTPTHGLLPTSSAAINNGSCRPGDPLADQRGVVRPQGIACDVGATEYLATCDQPLFSDGFETGLTGEWSQSSP